jgi:glyoxylase-like metal-dependent hydrolase (beta-lactamase superfamily II)
MQISDRVHSIDAETQYYTGPLAPNVWLIVDSGEAALIDSGFADEKALETRLGYLEKLKGVKLKEIILTHHHFDHSSAADTIRRKTGARISVHPDEEQFITNPREDQPEDIEIPEDQKELREAAKKWQEEARKARPDSLLADGDEVKIGTATIRAIHTPGHTEGSLCLMLDEENVLFTGDTILGRGTVAISPPPYGSMTKYLQSLEKLEGSVAERIAPGHGPVIDNPAQKCRELITHRHEREAQILKLLANGKTTVDQLLKAIYPEVDKRLHSFATSQILAHLHKFREEGVLDFEGKGRETTIHLKGPY